MGQIYCETERCLVRCLDADDFDNLLRAHEGPNMARYFPFPFDKDYLRGFLDRVRRAQEADGYSFGLIIDRQTKEPIGMAGLAVVNFEASFTPTVEIGWRVREDQWGNGIATETAHGMLTYGFQTLNLSEIVAFTAAINLPSKRVMERIGLRRREVGDFDHPMIDPASPLLRHVLYGLTLEEWRSQET